MPASFSIRALAVDPQRPKRVYAAGPDGLFVSDDAGKTWTASGQGLPTAPITALALDPARPATLYAAAEGHLYRSEDGAATWRAWPSP